MSEGEAVRPTVMLWTCNNCGDLAEVAPGGTCEVCCEGTIVERVYRAADEVEELRTRLVTTNECLRIYVEHRSNGKAIRDGWLEEEIAANDALLGEGAVERRFSGEGAS